jgi:hypothetical protein
MQIQNYYHYSFLWKLIVFTVNEHENICIAGLNRRAGYATACVWPLCTLVNFELVYCIRILMRIVECSCYMRGNIQSTLMQLACNSCFHLTLGMRLEKTFKPYSMLPNMPVYLIFFLVAKKHFQSALRSPNLLASLEACKLRHIIRPQNRKF